MQRTTDVENNLKVKFITDFSVKLYLQFYVKFILLSTHIPSLECRFSHQPFTSFYSDYSIQLTLPPKDTGLSIEITILHL